MSTVTGDLTTADTRSKTPLANAGSLWKSTWAAYPKLLARGRLGWLGSGSIRSKTSSNVSMSNGLGSAETPYLLNKSWC